MITAPAAFVSHGSPMFALRPGQLGPRLGRLGESLPDVRAVLIVSPHWQTRVVTVAATARPDTIHDFDGFPAELYGLQYPAPGAPEFAERTVAALHEAGIEAELDAHRGLDHGAWVPMRYLFPEASMPVFQVSMPMNLDTAGAARLGAALAPLRRDGVMIVGSGSMTHNLYEFGRRITDSQYAAEFADWVHAATTRQDIQSLIDYRGLAPHASRAHPTEEHYLPLLVAIGASAPDEKASWLEGGLTDGILNMDSYVWGGQEMAS